MASSPKISGSAPLAGVLPHSPEALPSWNDATVESIVLCLCKVYVQCRSPGPQEACDGLPPRILVGLARASLSALNSSSDARSRTRSTRSCAANAASICCVRSPGSRYGICIPNSKEDTVQYNTLQYSTVQYSPVKYSTFIHCYVPEEGHATRARPIHRGQGVHQSHRRTPV